MVNYCSARYLYVEFISCILCKWLTDHINIFHTNKTAHSYFLLKLKSALSASQCDPHVRVNRDQAFLWQCNFSSTSKALSLCLLRRTRV